MFLMICFVGLMTMSHAQISATITGTTAPTGTMSSPRYVIDSDAENADPAYNRNAILGSVNVRYQFSGSTSNIFRIRAQLLDAGNNAVALANGANANTISTTDEIDIVFSITINKVYPLAFIPAVDLGAGKSYRIHTWVERWNGTTWVLANGPTTSTSFVIVHFRDHPQSAALYARGYITDVPSWVNKDALQTGLTSTARSFRVSVPYALARYDLNGAAANIEMRFRVIMTDDLGANVPLQNSGQHTITVNRPAFTAGVPLTPNLLQQNATVPFAPVSQLDARNRSYRVRVEFEHIDVPNSGTYFSNGTSTQTGLQTLLHFNGNLRFGPLGSSIATVFTSYNNVPTASTFGVNLINTSLQITSGTLTGFPNHTFGNGTSLGVQLLSNGDSVVTSGSMPIVVGSGGHPSAMMGNIRVSYPDAVLNSTGARASSIVVNLPQGLSYTPNRNTSAGRFLPTITVTGTFPLGSFLRHSGDIGMETPATAWIFDESRTLLYRAENFSLSQGGEIAFKTPESRWVHQQAFDTLAANQTNSQHQLPSMAIRPTNEGYLRNVNVADASGSTTFVAAADGTARCEVADHLLPPAYFVTHFPLGSQIEFNSTGTLAIRGGLIDASSTLPDAKEMTIAFQRSCDTDACGPSAQDSRQQISMGPQDKTIHITADGGLFAPFGNSSTQLRWGLRADLTAAHRTDHFTKGSFLASGNHLYHLANPLGSSGPNISKSAILGPATIALAGYDRNNHGTPLYPQTNGYRDGVGSWPGATFTVDSVAMGASRLADMTSEYGYGLQTEVSKYYVRPSGLSGRHVAAEGQFSPTATLYDYNFSITRFQLTFLSNENVGSWVNGSVSVPLPAQFSQQFEELRLTCVGGLDSALIDPKDAGPKPLTYWGGQFTPVVLRFNPEEGGGCYDPRFLTLGLISGAANIATPLAGSLAFLPSGNIATLSANIEGTDGRLGLPARVPLKGPGNEIYPLHPVGKLYFNNPSTAGSPGPPDKSSGGFVSFAATCPVPFFEDLKLHVSTSAQAGLNTAEVFFTSGWTTGSGPTQSSFFTDQEFDPDHRGFPSGVSIANYRNPSTPTVHSVRANQSIFGLIPLSYPMKWSSGGRYFQSFQPIESDLFVIKAQHQVDYLSADNAEISFGAQYDGMPKINLASATYDAVDQRLGASRAITQAARGYVTDTLNKGVDEIGNLVNDTMESLLDDAVNEIAEQVIRPMYADLQWSYNQARLADQNYTQWRDSTTAGAQAVFNQYFDTTVLAGANSVKGRLKDLSNATAEASSLIKRVESAVDQGILAIDAVAGRLRIKEGNVEFNLNLPIGELTSPTLPSVSDGVIAGLLAKVPVGGTEQRVIVQRLVAELIRELAPPDLANALSVILAEVTNSANAELNEMLLKFDPTLERITETLMEARAYLVSVRLQLQAGQTIVRNFEDIITSADEEINTLVNAMRTRAINFINNVSASAALPLDRPLDEIGNLFEEFPEQLLVDTLRAELRNLLFATGFVQKFQYVLRQYISEFDMALRSAIDSAFGEVNRLCKHLVKKALGPIDDTINGLLGEISSVVGAGSLDGYAHIQGRTLRRLRLDAMTKLKVPDDLKLQAYFEMLCYDSSTDSGNMGACLQTGEEVVEIKIGAIDVPLDWISPDLRGTFNAWFSMKNIPAQNGNPPSVLPKGFGLGLIVDGEIDFQSFKIQGFHATGAVGSSENYLGAGARFLVSNYEAAGGVFFGRTCSITPLLQVDPDAASVLGQPPFTGAYVYGEVWIPISEVVLGIPASCLFRISAGVGAGAFFFTEGPTFGGKMLLGVSGEALCIVSIRGEVALVGVVSDGSLRFTGRGTLTGKAGYCPFCVKFRESAKVTYQNGSWSVDF